MEAGTIGAGPNETFGPVLLVETEVVDQLLLNLEGFAAFFTLVPAAEMDRNAENTTERHQMNKLQSISGQWWDQTQPSVEAVILCIMEQESS